MSLPSQEKVLTLSRVKVSISETIKSVNSIPNKVNMKFNFMLKLSHDCAGIYHGNFLRQTLIQLKNMNIRILEHDQYNVMQVLIAHHSFCLTGNTMLQQCMHVAE